MPLKDFEIVSKLGEGAYSTVYKVMRKEDKKTYALKRVKINPLSNKEKENSLNEVRILASLNHPNIISYKEAFIDEATKSLCIVMEFANNSDLAHQIEEKQSKEEFFPEEQIWNIFIQIVKGLNILHEHNIFHRDLKSANVFLHEENGEIAKLGDMNVSKISEKGLCMTQTGTPYYASPEVWKDQPYDSKSDIWSLGCVLYEMITLQPPFKAEDMEALFKKVTRGIYPKIPSQYSKDLSEMVRCLLQVNPLMRPDCEKILKNPLMLKKMKNLKLTEEGLKSELLRTIRAGESFSELNENLPKANYSQGRSVKKEKTIKSLMEVLEEKTSLIEIESFPVLEKEKKIRPAENSDRVFLKEKHSINMLSRDRKKSEMTVDRTEKHIKGLEMNNLNTSNKNSNTNLIELKELKLPKVLNRYNKIKERMYKQNSLRAHKIYE